MHHFSRRLTCGTWIQLSGGDEVRSMCMNSTASRIWMSAAQAVAEHGASTSRTATNMAGELLGMSWSDCLVIGLDL